MTDERAVWDEKGDKFLEEKGMFPHKEAQSDKEDIQNQILNLISELNSLKEKLLEQDLTDVKAQKVSEYLRIIQHEITEINKIVS